MDLWTFHLKRKKKLPFFMISSSHVNSFLMTTQKWVVRKNIHTLSHLHNWKLPFSFHILNRWSFYSGTWLKFISLHGFFFLHLLTALTLSAFPNVYSPLSSLFYIFQLPYDLCMSCIETKRDTPSITCCWTLVLRETTHYLSHFFIITCLLGSFFQVLE